MLAMDTDDWDNAIGRVYLGNGNCIKLDATCRVIPFEGIQAKLAAIIYPWYDCEFLQSKNEDIIT